MIFPDIWTYYILDLLTKKGKFSNIKLKKNYEILKICKFVKICNMQYFIFLRKLNKFFFHILSTAFEKTLKNV